MKRLGLKRFKEYLTDRKPLISRQITLTARM
jgi:hypothetical protein